MQVLQSLLSLVNKHIISGRAFCSLNFCASFEEVIQGRDCN